MDEIQDFFEKGIVNDTLLAEYNLTIYNKVALNYADLLKLPKSKRKMFAYVQESAAHRLMLYLSRCYERPFGESKNRSLRSFEKLVAMNYQSTKIRIPQYSMFENKSYSHLRSYQLESKTLKIFLVRTNSALQRKPLSKHVNAVKNFRDKFVAHNEVHHELVVDKQSPLKLIEFNKAIVHAIGHGVFNSSYVNPARNEFTGSYLNTAWIDEILRDNLNGL